MTQILHHVDESSLVSLEREIIINVFSVQKIMKCVLLRKPTLTADFNFPSQSSLWHLLNWGESSVRKKISFLHKFDYTFTSPFGVQRWIYAMAHRGPPNTLKLTTLWSVNLSSEGRCLSITRFGVQLVIFPCYCIECLQTRFNTVKLYLKK